MTAVDVSLFRCRRSRLCSVTLSKAIILVTGASGFIGRHILTRLLGENCALHAVNRHGSGPSSEHVTWHAADLRDPRQALELVHQVRPTHVLHNAWIATPDRFWSDAENLDWLQGGLTLLRGFGEVGGRRFVGVGSCAEYDWQQASFVEDETPVRPATLYGKSKAAMWAATQAFAMHYGFSASWGRIFLPYGLGDSPQRLIPMVIASLLAGRKILLRQPRAKRDFIYAPDVADLLVRMLDSIEEGAFNVGTGRGTEIGAVVSRIADRLGGSSLLEFGTASELSSEPKWLVADMRKSSARLGWSSPPPVEERLEQLLDEVVSQHAATRAADSSMQIRVI